MTHVLQCTIDHLAHECDGVAVEMVGPYSACAIGAEAHRVYEAAVQERLEANPEFTRVCRRDCAREQAFERAFA